MAKRIVPIILGWLIVMGCLIGLTLALVAANR